MIGGPTWSCFAADFSVGHGGLKTYRCTDGGCDVGSMDGTIKIVTDTYLVEPIRASVILVIPRALDGLYWYLLSAVYCVLPAYQRTVLVLMLLQISRC